MTPPNKPKRGRPHGSPKAFEGSVKIEVRMDAATLARLDKIRTERGETRSQCVRSLIDLWE